MGVVYARICTMTLRSRPSFPPGFGCGASAREPEHSSGPPLLSPGCHASCQLAVGPGLRLRKEVRMDHLSELGRPGLGWQDVESVYFLLILGVYFPANTDLAATCLSQGRQRQRSVAHEQPCENKPRSSARPSVPAREARTGRAAQSLGTIWSSGREGRKTISNSRRREPLTDGHCWEKGKLNALKELCGASGKGEDFEVRGLLPRVCEPWGWR